MSQYYTPRPATQRTSSSQASSSAGVERSPLQVNPEDSIYVFPNPPSSSGSIPASPSIGSDISIPTDLTSSHFSDVRSRASSQDATSSRRTRLSSPPADSIGRHFSIGADGDPEVEIWDWNADDTDSIAVSDESSGVDLEAEIDRAQRWELLTHRVQRVPRDQISTSSVWRARQQQLDHESRFRPLHNVPLPTKLHRRHRSNASDPGPLVIHPHIRIPLLSFIASMLFVDESTVRLLTHPSSESTLFPGHSSSVDEESTEDEDEPRETKLLSSTSEESGSQRLKEGLAATCDHDLFPFNPFSLTRSIRFNGLWGLVNGVWSSGGQAWREVWTV